MDKERAIFSIYHRIPDVQDYPIDRFHMTFSDVWSYVNFVEQYGLNLGQEKYFLKDVNFMFSLLNNDGNSSTEQVYLTLEKR